MKIILADAVTDGLAGLRTMMFGEAISTAVAAAVACCALLLLVVVLRWMFRSVKSGGITGADLEDRSGWAGWRAQENDGFSYRPRSWAGVDSHDHPPRAITGAKRQTDDVPF